MSIMDYPSFVNARSGAFNDQDAVLLSRNTLGGILCELGHCIQPLRILLVSGNCIKTAFTSELNFDVL